MKGGGEINQGGTGGEYLKDTEKKKVIPAGSPRVFQADKGEHGWGGKKRLERRGVPSNHDHYKKRTRKSNGEKKRGGPKPRGESVLC